MPLSCKFISNSSRRYWEILIRINYMSTYMSHKIVVPSIILGQNRSSHPIPDRAIVPPVHLIFYLYYTKKFEFFQILEDFKFGAG